MALVTQLLTEVIHQQEQIVLPDNLQPEHQVLQYKEGLQVWVEVHLWGAALQWAEEIHLTTQLHRQEHLIQELLTLQPQDCLKNNMLLTQDILTLE